MFQTKWRKVETKRENSIQSKSLQFGDTLGYCLLKITPETTWNIIYIIKLLGNKEISSVEFWGKGKSN